MIDYVRLPPYRVDLLNVPKSEQDGVDWGVASYGIPELWKKSQGEGVTVAVVDSGIAPHPALTNVVDRRNFSGDTEMLDSIGHGTGVAGIIGATCGAAKGIAPKVKLLSLKVLGHCGMGSNDAVAQAVRFAADAGVDLICMSLGSPNPSDHVHQAVQYANGKGVTIVCAAGNDGGSVNFPAAFTETIAVGAVDRNGNACEFSCKGREIVVAAPGQDITSTWLGGGYATLSGTSFAAPFVVGVLALYVSANGKCNLQCAMDALSQTCRDVGSPGRDDQYGWGLLDPHKLLGHSLQAKQTQDGITIWIPGAKVI